MPTFCRGWGTLPFDRSSPDITAHALRAVRDAEPDNGKERRRRHKLAAFLAGRRTHYGYWLPLWFGNEHARPPGGEEENPVYGTARVLAAVAESPYEPAVRSDLDALPWLLQQQNDDGGFGGHRGTPSTIEETGVALEGLLVARAAYARHGSPVADFSPAIDRGLRWLVDAIDAGRHRTPAPIGFYFAKLWYFERLYPHAFALGALQAAVDAHPADDLPKDDPPAASR